MNGPDYTFIFDDIAEVFGCVQVINHQKREPHQVQVAVNDIQLLYRNYPIIPAVIADFIDVAITVYIADRLAHQQKDKPRNIHIIVPVRNPEIFNSAQSNILLQRVLYSFTNDNWSFEFKHRNKVGRLAEQQFCLPLVNDLIEVALWSGGLDSLASTRRHK